MGVTVWGRSSRTRGKTSMSVVDGLKSSARAELSASSQDNQQVVKLRLAANSFSNPIASPSAMRRLEVVSGLKPIRPLE